MYVETRPGGDQHAALAPDSIFDRLVFPFPMANTIGVEMNYFFSESHEKQSSTAVKKKLPSGSDSGTIRT